MHGDIQSVQAWALNGTTNHGPEPASSDRPIPSAGQFHGSRCVYIRLLLSALMQGAQSPACFGGSVHGPSAERRRHGRL